MTITLLPVGISGPGKDIQSAINRMLCRVAHEARRCSVLDTSISIASVDVIATFEKLYSETLTVEEAVRIIDNIFS